MLIFLSLLIKEWKNNAKTDCCHQTGTKILDAKLKLMTGTKSQPKDVPS